MSFKTLIFGLVALSVGAVVFTSTSGEVADGKGLSTAVANSPTEGQTATPSLRNFVDAFSIAVGGNGEMHSMGGPSDARLVTDPARTRRAQFYGWKVEHPGLTGPGDSIHLVQSALSGVPMQQMHEFPGEILAQAASTTCTVPERAAGAKLASVQVFAGLQESGYHAVTDRELVGGALEFLNDLQRSRTPEIERPSGATKAVPVVNVVLTDESAPLYLVLQASAGSVLWNLHATPGVRVSEIVIVGNPGSAVRPLAPETPVTFLGIGANCAPQPWRATNPHWAMVTGGQADRAAARGDDPDQTYREASEERHARYDAWFAATFGENSEAVSVGAWEANHVLFGPLPASSETRAPYRPLTGARIVAHEGPLLYVTSPRERAADISARRLALATEAAGGDLSIVNPEPVERTQ